MPNTPDSEKTAREIADYIQAFSSAVDQHHLNCLTAAIEAYAQAAAARARNETASVITSASDLMAVLDGPAVGIREQQVIDPFPGGKITALRDALSNLSEIPNSSAAAIRARATHGGDQGSGGTTGLAG